MKSIWKHPWKSIHSPPRKISWMSHEMLQSSNSVLLPWLPWVPWVPWVPRSKRCVSCANTAPLASLFRGGWVTGWQGPESWVSGFFSPGEGLWISTKAATSFLLGGCIPTPLKNEGVRQLRDDENFPINFWDNKIHGNQTTNQFLTRSYFF